MTSRPSKSPAAQPSLFDDEPSPAPPADVEEPWWVRNPPTEHLRKLAMMWRGEHPLSNVASSGYLAVHPDESLTCGGCKHFEHYPAQGQSIWPPAKCTLGATRGADGRITAAPRFPVKVPGAWYPETFEDQPFDLQPSYRACRSHEAAPERTDG